MNEGIWYGIRVVFEEHMSDFLNELKYRLQDAQRRLQAAQQDSQAAQAKLNAVAQEFNSLQFLVNAETAKQSQSAGSATPPTPVTPSAQTTLSQSPELNKTDLIRGLLRDHPAGMTPTEIWRLVKGQITHRAYLYSVLKRLKDRDEVSVRRGKYVPKIMTKNEEDKVALVLQ